MSGKVQLTVVRNSEIADFRTCRQKWELRHVRQLIPKARARALEVGTIAHEGFAAMYREIMRQQHAYATTLDIDLVQQAVSLAAEAGIASWRKRTESVGEWFSLSDEQQHEMIVEAERVSREALTAISMFVRTFAREDFERFQVQEVEQSFEVRLGRSWAVSTGTRDVVLCERDSDATILGEHKTTAGRADDYDARFDVDPQPRQYLHALRAQGHKHTGRVIYNVVSKSSPRSPEVNKDGHVSVAKIDTTRDRYEAALEQQVQARNLVVTEKQRAMLDSLPRSTERWAQRYEFYLDEAELLRWESDFIADATLIRQARNGKLPITKNGASCSLPWQPPCPMRRACVDPVAGANDYDTPEELAARIAAHGEPKKGDELEQWLGF